MSDVDDMWDDEEDNEMVREMFGRRKAGDDYEDVNQPNTWIMEKDAEITRLRAENKKLREQLRGEIESHQAMTKAYENEIKMLKESREITRLRDELAAVTAERDRMKEALEPFKQRSFDCGGRHILSREYVLVKWLLDARAAIEGVTDKKNG